MSCAVGVAVLRYILDHELGFGEHGPEWCVAAADPLSTDNQIRDYVPVIESPAAAGAPEPGHHLVGDKEDPVAVTDLADALKIPRCGGNRAERSSNDRLGDERSNVLSTHLADGVFELVSAGEITCGTGAVRAATIRVAWRDVLGGRQDGSERPAT